MSFFLCVRQKDLWRDFNCERFTFSPKLISMLINELKDGSRLTMFIIVWPEFRIEIILLLSTIEGKARCTRLFSSRIRSRDVFLARVVCKETSEKLYTYMYDKA